MKLRQFAILLLLFVATSCRPQASSGKVFVLIRLENKASGMLVASMVDGGVGEIDIGYLIPDGTAGYLNFPAAGNASLNFKYRFENGSFQSASNLLHRGIRANEEITITVTDSGVSAKAVDSSH